MTGGQPSSRARCPRCLGGPGSCLCEALVPVDTRVRVVVLQHVLEASKLSNTGRFVTEVLRPSELRLYGAQGSPPPVEDLAHATLLFPGAGPSDATLPASRSLLVLDASWSQARRMVQRLPALRALPRLSLKVDAPQKSLRDAPPGGLSTLQAVARALALWGEDEAATALEDVHARLFARTLAARGYV